MGFAHDGTISSKMSMFSIAIIGIYIGIILEEVEQRPIYLVKQVLSRATIPAAERTNVALGPSGETTGARN